MTRTARRSPLRGLSRRAALAALGASAAGAVLAPCRRDARAQAAGARYFIGVYMPHGMARELWVPRPGFEIAYEGSVLAPLDDPATYGQSFRDRIVALEGLDLTAGIRAATTGHDASRVMLTGSAMIPSISSSPSSAGSAAKRRSRAWCWASVRRSRRSASACRTPRAERLCPS